MATKPLWIWEPDLQRYRDTKTGRFVGVQQMQGLRNEFIAAQQERLRGVVRAYANNNITYNEMTGSIKQTLKDTYIDMYTMGAGGRNNMTQADWGSVGGMIKEQHVYLDRLLGQIERAEISPRQAAARLNMYANSANEALWRGIARGLPQTLPAYPGDGSTVCLTNCQCEWEIIETEEGFECYWRLGAAEHCPDCIQRSQTWNPYIIRKG